MKKPSPSRIASTEQRRIDGRDVTVNTLEMLEYNGEWIAGGYEVILGESSHYFLGWPTNSDIEKVNKSNGTN